MGTAKQGSSGRGWYKKYEKEGEEGFRKYNPPTPFDWSEAGATSLVYLDVSVDGADPGRVEIELLDEILPITTTNFKKLCTGENPDGLSYADTPIHHVVKDSAIVAGDVELKTGKGSHSALGTRYFDDEALVMPHTEAGIVSMVNGGVDTNGSQFYITTAPSPQLDGYSVAFGRVTSGMDVVGSITNLFSIRGVPVSTVTVTAAGVLREGGGAEAASA